MGDGTLVIVIKSRDETKETMEGLKGGLSGLAASAGTAGKAVGTAVAVGAAAAATAVVALGAAMVVYTGDATMAAARASEMRAVLDLLGERAGWSSAEIQGNVEAMKQLGIRTDVATDVLAQYARNQLDAADATKMARVAQDLAVLSGRDSSETLAELNYAILTQNSSLQVFRDLGLQAGETMDAYAKSLGVATKDLTQQQRIQAMINGVMEKGVSIAGVYETAMQEPGKAMRSLSRHFYEAKLAVGEHFLPVMSVMVGVVEKMVKSVRGLLEEGQPLNMLLTALGERAGEAAERLGDLVVQGIDNMIAGIGPMVEYFQANVLPVLAEFADWMRTYIPLAVQKLTDIWNGTLLPALQGLWKFLTVDMMPIWNALGDLLGPMISRYINMQVGMWQNVLWPAIQAIWKFLTVDMMPVWKALGELLYDFVLTRIQALATTWNDVLWPALDAIWKFLSVDMMPIWEALGELIGVVVVASVERLTAFWQNVLWPLLEKIHAFLADKLNPIWEKLGTLIEEKVIPFFDTLKTSLGGVQGIIETVVGWIETFSEMIRNLTLPDWLKPGSPTPFEIGLRGINAAMKELAQSRLPDLQVGLGDTGGYNRVNGIGGMDGGITNNFSLVINSQADTESILNDFRLMQAMV